MGRLTVEVPSIDTEYEYEVGQGLRIQKGKNRSTGKRNESPTETWHAEVVGINRSHGDERRSSWTVQTTEAQRGTLTDLPPIENDGRSEYVRRVVVELRSDSLSRLEGMDVDGLQVYNSASNKLRSKVLKVFDIKEMLRR